MSDTPVIRTQGLVKVYAMGATGVRALRGIDLTVGRGEFVAVMGASGSGKSTLMNILGCLDVPTEGTYDLDGERTNGLDRNALADIRNRKIGFVFQGFNLLARTSAVENVELPLLYDRSDRKVATRKLALDALDRVGLADRSHHLPNELSGGQQQRVAIARALISDPTLIVADEPTGDLDRTTAEEILGLLERLNRELGKTIVMVTHDPKAAEKAHRVAHLEKGVLAG